MSLFYRKNSPNTPCNDIINRTTFFSKINQPYRTFSENISNNIASMLNFNNISKKLINSYQKKISYYDKQQWERSLEDHIILRAENICPKQAKSSCCSCCNLDDVSAKSVPSTPNNPTINSTPLTNDLIDLDLISGSAYTMKSKSQQGWLSSFVNAIIRVLFLPLYLRWWSERTSPRLTSLLLILYILQVAVLRIYYHRGITSLTAQNLPLTLNKTFSSFSGSSVKSNEFSEVSPTEVLMPIAMMLILGVIHMQIVGTKSYNSSATSSSTVHSSNNSSFCSRKNSTQSYKKESFCQSAHTECSSSPLSSSSSSVDSSPISNIKTRLQNRLEKLSNTSFEKREATHKDIRDTEEETINKHRKDKLPKFKIPEIQIQEDHKMQNILLCCQRDYLSDECNNNFSSCLNRNKKDVLQNKPPKPLSPVSRRYSESKDFSKISKDSQNPRRRYSETSTSKMGNSKLFRFPTDTLNNIQRRRPLKNRLRNDLKIKKLNCNSYWTNDDQHLSLSSLSPLKTFYSNYNGSSFDSEGTISPVTPINSMPGDDWPMINSDANTSEIDDEDNNFFSFGKISQKQNVVSSELKSGNDSVLKTLDKARYHKPNYIDISQENSKTLRHSQNNKSKESIKSGDVHSNQFLEPNTSNELKVSCSIWQHNVCQKVNLSVMDISSAIIRKVETIEHSTEYICLGIIFSITIGILPAIYRMQYSLTTNSSTNNGPNQYSSNVMNPFNTSFPNISISSTSDLIQLDLFSLWNLFLDESLFINKSLKVRFVVCVSMLERLVLSFFYFFLLCVAERTFKQRFLYSKYFSQITRRDRAKRSQVPHFRLHKVRNLKVWLSVRSYLRRHGPHRSVDTICSTSFIIAICLLTCISLQMLKDSSDNYTSRLICWEMVFWTLALGLYIMRLMILGSRINQKYRSNLSILITEQINLYLQLERKPHKKDALMLANHVLKLAVDLLKELESPYKISGFSANPYLYNITKVVVLSAFSAVLTEMLGFKLKLYKIKLIR